MSRTMTADAELLHLFVSENKLQSKTIRDALHVYKELVLLNHSTLAPELTDSSLRVFDGIITGMKLFRLALLEVERLTRQVE